MNRPWLTYSACEDLVQAERNDLDANRARTLLESYTAERYAGDDHLDFSVGELALLAGGHHV